MLRRTAPRPTARRRTLARALPIALGAGALACVGLALAFAGGWRPWAAASDPYAQPPGTVAVPISPRPIAAYARVRLEDLIDPRSRQVGKIFLPPEAVRPQMLLELTDIVGRVLRREKPAGFVFTENDFAPRGTPPGLAAGIPAGKRAMRVDVGKVNGLEALNAGDRFDLVATLKLDASSLSGDLGGLRTADAIALDPALANWTQQATVQVIVQNGLLVEPVTTRVVPISATTLTQGEVSRTRPVQEVVIALDPSEVARLTEAIAIGAQVQSVIRSGHPDDPPESVTPSADPRSPFESLQRGVAGGDAQGGGFRMIESFDAQGRRYIAVREGSGATPTPRESATAASPAAPSAAPRGSLPGVGAPDPEWNP